MIKAIIFDVDGSLTNGQIFIGETGELMKSFNVKDGYALSNLCPKNNLIPIILTGRESKITTCRAKELKIDYVYQGIEDKTHKIEEISSELNISFYEMAYFGDDLNDLGCIRKVRYSGCPADAVKEIKNYVNFVCSNNGGCGAAREFIEYIIKVNNEDKR